MTNGLVVMTPTTVDKTGGSSTATINADGSVTFGSCATITLNGVFTADYDNYMAVIDAKPATGDEDFWGRLTSGGVPSTTGYTRQTFYANGTSVVVARATYAHYYISAISATSKSGYVQYFFGPYLTQPTAFRTTSVWSYSGAILLDPANTHSVSASYDGFLMEDIGGTITGKVTVFGFNQ